jgi:hypothetical protein
MRRFDHATVVIGGERQGVKPGNVVIVPDRFTMGDSVGYNVEGVTCDYPSGFAIISPLPIRP